MNRPFDLKAALSGEPVMFPRGTDVYTFVEFDHNNRHLPLKFSRDGGSDSIWTDLDGDNVGRVLVMAPRRVKKTVYVNLYKNGEAYWSEQPQTAADYAVAVARPVEIEVSE